MKYIDMRSFPSFFDQSIFITYDIVRLHSLPLALVNWQVVLVIRQSDLFLQ